MSEVVFLSGTVQYYSERNKASKKNSQGRLVDCKVVAKERLLCSDKLRYFSAVTLHSTDAQST